MKETETETPKTDFLKWWLVFLTIVSIFVWLGTVRVFISSFRYYLDSPVVFLPFGALEILIPYIAISSWRHKRIGMKKQSKLDSFVLLIVISFTLIFDVGLIITMDYI